MFSPRYNIEMARLRSAELEQSARRYRASRKEAPPLPVAQPITMRIGALTESVELTSIAKLAPGRSPLAPFLIGELAGQPVAAVSLMDGAVGAGRDEVGGGGVALLRLRALQLRRRHARPNS
jgi:hypothetical protein